MDDIRLALSRLDPKNDDHWTADGVPRVDVVSTMVGRAVTRKEIVDSSPQLTRATPAPPAAVVVPPQDGDEPPADPETAPTVVMSPQEQALADARAEADDLLQQSLALAAEIADVQKMKADVDARHARAVATIERLGPTQEHQERDNIRNYLQNQQRRREARHKQIAGVLQDGVKVRDVLAAASGRSALDNAMGHRKAPLGAGRPAPRAPAPPPKE